MRVLDYPIQLRMPSSKYRWWILTGLVVLSGVIPDTTSDLTGLFIYCGFPLFLAIVVTHYWRNARIPSKAVLSVSASLIAFLVRLLPSSLYNDFNYVTHFFHVDWNLRYTFLALFGFQAVATLLILMPLHFVLKKREVRNA
ncbi:MAG: hypothetical protein H0X66_13875 [Verrucomicrobia bacterium]|nr:hypothetical protein [Verrucomicrobiota bacterium]